MHCIQNSGINTPSQFNKVLAGFTCVAAITVIALGIIGITAQSSGPFNAIVQLGTTTNGTLLGISIFVLILDLAWIQALCKKTKEQPVSLPESPTQDLISQEPDTSKLRLRIKTNEQPASEPELPLKDLTSPESSIAQLLSTTKSEHPSSKSSDSESTDDAADKSVQELQEHVVHASSDTESSSSESIDSDDVREFARHLHFVQNGIAFPLRLLLGLESDDSTSAATPDNSSSSSSESESSTSEESSEESSSSESSDAEKTSKGVGLCYIFEENQHLRILHKDKIVPIEQLPSLLLQTFRNIDIQLFERMFLKVLLHPDFKPHIEEFLKLILDDCLRRPPCSWLIPFWENHFSVLVDAFQKSHDNLISYLKTYHALLAVEAHEALRSQIVNWVEAQVSQGHIPHKVACAIEQYAGNFFTSKYVFKNQDQAIFINGFLIQALACTNPYLQALTKGGFKECKYQEVVVEDDSTTLQGVVEYYRTGNVIQFLEQFGDQEEALYNLQKAFDYRFIPENKLLIPLRGLKILRAIDEGDLSDLRHHFEQLDRLLDSNDFTIKATSLQSFKVRHRDFSDIKPWAMDQLCQVLKLVTGRMDQCEIKLTLGEVDCGNDEKSRQRSLSNLSKLTQCLAPFVTHLNLDEFHRIETARSSANDEICSIIEKSASSFVKLKSLSTGPAPTHSLIFKLLHESGSKIQSLDCSKQKHALAHLFSEVTTHCPQLETLYCPYSSKVFEELDTVKTQFTSLYPNGCEYNRKIVPKQINRIANNCPQLKFLDLSDLFFKKIQFNDLNQLMIKCPSLHIQFRFDRSGSSDHWLQPLRAKYPDRISLITGYSGF